MLRKKIWIGVLFIVVFLPTALLAQEMMHGKWWHDKSLKQELKLTDGEVKTLDARYNESRRKMIDLKGEVEKQRFELELALGADESSMDKIMQRYESLEQARMKLSRERFEMLMAIRETIGPERFQELKLMYRDRDDRRGRGRSADDRSFYKDRDRDRDHKRYGD